MSRITSSGCALGVICAALFLVGCWSRYVAPTSDAPHAIIKYRRIYGETPGTTLSEFILINGDAAFSQSGEAARGKVPRTDAILVHPVPATFTFTGGFTHSESKTRVESYHCGSDGRYGTCYRTITDTVTMKDGFCRKQIGLHPQADQVILVELDYQAGDRCTFRCMVQHSLGGGKFRNEPCSDFPVGKASRNTRRRSNPG